MIRVLSIKQPYVSLILENIKTIETRSYKTNYRGELYIHSSKLPIESDKAKKATQLLKNKDFKYGCILLKCELVDCVYIDEDFVKKLSQEEILCGDYTLGRYAWILKNVKEIDPIYANGKLGIWKYELK